MTPELAYFLKINIAIALFYAFYRLLDVYKRQNLEKANLNRKS